MKTLETIREIRNGLRRLPHVVTTFYRCISEVETALHTVRLALTQAAEQPVWFIVEGERVEEVGRVWRHRFAVDPLKEAARIIDPALAVGDDEPPPEPPPAPPKKIPIQLAKRALPGGGSAGVLLASFDPQMSFRVLRVFVIGPAEIVDVRIGRDTIFVSSEIGITHAVDAGGRECWLGSRITVVGERLGVRDSG